MSRHEVFPPRWIPEESLVFPWFQSLGLEFLDVALLVHHRLNTPTRTLPGAISNMKHINEEQWRKGYPPMCDLGMLDWNKTAVVDYLIRLTDDENLLANLLWFDQQDVWMLISVGPTSYSFSFVRSWLIAS